MSEYTFIDNLFSTPLYGKALNINTNKIVSELQKYDFHNAGFDDFPDTKEIAAASNCLNVLNNKKFKDLKKVLMNEFHLFTKEHMRYTNQFKITTSWFTKALKGQSSNWHNHNNSMYSAVLYLQTDENSGAISFNKYENKRFDLEVQDFNILNSTEWKITPVNGLFLIFPSEIYHKAQENKSDIVRHSLALNFLPTGLLGRTSADSHAKINVGK
jgi:uncharacterized protein (TIGR02466 family)